MTFPYLRRITSAALLGSIVWLSACSSQATSQIPQVAAQNAPSNTIATRTATKAGIRPNTCTQIVGIGHVRPNDDGCDDSDGSSDDSSTTGGTTCDGSTCVIPEDEPGNSNDLSDVTTGDSTDMCSDVSSGNCGPIGCVGNQSTCKNVPCSASPETIGDYFRPKGSNSSILVTDINSIWQDGAEVGWLYLGNNGVRYIQANYSTKVGVSFGISIGFFGASLQAGAVSPIEQWNGSLPAGSGVQKCESQGGQLA